MIDKVHFASFTMSLAAIATRTAAPAASSKPTYQEAQSYAGSDTAYKASRRCKRDRRLHLSLIVLDSLDKGLLQNYIQT